MFVNWYSVLNSTWNFYEAEIYFNDPCFRPFRPYFWLKRHLARISLQNILQFSKQFATSSALRASVAFSCSSQMTSYFRTLTFARWCRWHVITKVLLTFHLGLGSTVLYSSACSIVFVSQIDLVFLGRLFCFSLILSSASYLGLTNFEEIFWGNFLLGAESDIKVKS